MCRALKVLIVAPSDRVAELRRALSSIEYEIVTDGPADVAVVWEPAPGDVETLREQGLKVVAVGGAGEGADMRLDADSLASFRQRVRELFKAR